MTSLQSSQKLSYFSEKIQQENTNICSGVAKGEPGRAFAHPTWQKPHLFTLIEWSIHAYYSNRSQCPSSKISLTK